MKDFKDFEDSTWFIGMLAAVAAVVSLALISAVWFSMLGGAAR